MNCNHDESFLMGTATGITCRACGARFESWAELMASRPEPEALEAEAPKPKRKLKLQRSAPKKAAL